MFCRRMYKVIFIKFKTMQNPIVPQIFGSLKYIKNDCPKHSNTWHASDSQAYCKVRNAH